MELSDYLRILRKNVAVILVALFVGVAVAGAWSWTRTPVYQAQSKVFVSTQAGSTIGELQQGSSFTQARVLTYVDLVSTPTVLGPVIDEVGLNVTAEALAQQISASNPANTTMIQIRVADPDPIRAAEIANAVGTSLASAVEEIETLPSSEGSPVKLTRVSDATAPQAPSSPRTTLNLALGGLLGFAIGLGIAVLRTALDTRIRSAQDIAQLTDRPIIGMIPFDPKAETRPIILQDDPLNPRSEALRTLRTNLQFLEMEGAQRFVVTSSVPREGKSTTAINLAIALADAGQRVALIDADLRKPKVAEYLQIEGGVGLTDVLIGRAQLEDVMLPWGGRSIEVLPAGRIPPNPSELLGSQQMESLLETISQRADVIILDAPPLLPVTDAAVLVRRSAGAMMVVAVGITTRHQLASAMTALETVDAKIAGVVLSMVPTKGPDAYGYGYGTGYGYGYGDLEESNGKTVRRSKRHRAAPGVG